MWWWWEGRLVLEGRGRLVRESGRARGRGKMGVVLGYVHAYNVD